MSNNKFKVLIIEDEANICSFIQTLLETNGYQALVAQTCVMGMTMFISYNPDLVILDLGLPDRDGLDAICSIRQKYLTPIIVLSARTTEQDKIEALDLGANDYITKPFGTGELLARVRAALRVNRYGGGFCPGGTPWATRAPSARCCASAAAWAFPARRFSRAGRRCAPGRGWYTWGCRSRCGRWRQ